jgi:transcriptional regulator with XRE-family HTH domain
MVSYKIIGMVSGIPSRLKEARKKLNLNQIQIAADLDIQQKSISDIENGKIQNIPNTYIMYFYKKGISLEWLYTGKGEMRIGNILESNTPADEPITRLFDGTKAVKQQAIEKELDTPSNPEKEFPMGLPDTTPVILYERLIDSKEYNIRSLLAYIKSLESNLAYVKELLDRVKPASNA